MVSKFFKLLSRDLVSMNQAALVLAIFSILSQLFGLLRDHLLASLVGPSVSLDVYYAAFRIPDFVYNSFGCLLSVTVLIPFIAQFVQEEKEEGKRGGMRVFLNSVFSVFFIGMLALSIVLIVLMPYLTHLVAPGFDAAARHELVLYARIMLLSPFFFGLSSLLSSFAQAEKKFFSFAIAPLFYNLGILLGIVLLRPMMGMLGVVIGVVVGAAMYFVIQIPTLVALNKVPKLTRAIDWSLIKRIMTLSLPRTLGSSLTNITFVIISAMASLLAAGSISIFQFSYNIENTPLLIIGVSYAVAAFPTMTRLFAEGNKKELLDVLYRTTRTIFFFCIPISLLMIVLRAHIVRILLGAGAFSWDDTRLVAASVALFALSIAAQCMVLLLVRAFYAVGDTKTPLRINIWSVVTTIASAAAFLFLYRDVSFFHDFLNSLMRIEDVGGSTVVLLALGFSVGQTVNAIWLWKKFHAKFHGTVSENRTLTRTIMHMLASGIIAAASAYAMLSLVGDSVDQSHFWGILTQAVIATAIGAVMYAIILRALRNEDIVVFLETARSKFWKTKPVIVAEQQEL
jgi:putative peptidoglycan lipid II flippase